MARFFINGRVIKVDRKSSFIDSIGASEVFPEIIDELPKVILSNKKECKKSFLERKGPTERIKSLRVFDGKKMIKSNQITLNKLLHLMKEIQMLMGWELGIPKHLSYRGELPVIKN